MPCRGSGRVISNLEGTRSEVTCPWCQGGGVRVAGVDAQAAWATADDPAAGARDGAEQTDTASQTQA